MKKKKYLLGIAACGMMILAGCSQNTSSKIQMGAEEKNEMITTEECITEECETEEAATKEVTAEESYEMFDSFELIDYAVLARIMSQEKGEIAACDLLDVDQDGKKELFVEKTIPLDGNGEEIISNYCFDDYNNPCADIYTDVSAAGDAGFKIDYSNNKVYLSNFYVTIDYGYVQFMLWEHGWNEIGVQERETNLETGALEVTTCVWNGQDVKSELWDREEKVIEDVTTGLKDMRTQILSFVVEDGSCAQISRDYEEHLKALEYNYIAKTGDIDNDGAEEYCYFVEDYAKPWRKHLNSLNELEEENFVQGSDNAVSVIVIDKQGNTIVVRTAYAGQSVNIEDVDISADIRITDDEAVSVYKLDGEGNLVFQSRKYKGKIMDIVRNNHLFVPGRQSEFWQEFSFYENGEMIYRNVSVDEEIVYSEQKGTYRVDEETNTLYFQLEDDWESEYVFVESEGIFDGGIGMEYFPDDSERPIRYFMVPCKEFPTKEQLYKFYEYYNWNIEN